MNKRCASSITGNWEDDHSILKTDNKEHLLGWRVYCPRARYPSATRHPPLLFPRKINICWGLVIIGYTARVRPRVCVQLYTCLWLSWHMLVATFHQTRPECDGAAQKSRVFWQQPVRLWWNTPGRWLSMGSKNKMGLISVLRKEWTFRSMEMFLILTPSKSCDFWSDKITKKYSKYTLLDNILCSSLHYYILYACTIEDIWHIHIFSSWSYVSEGRVYNPDVSRHAMAQERVEENWTLSWSCHPVIFSSSPPTEIIT